MINSNNLIYISYDTFLTSELTSLIYTFGQDVKPYSLTYAIVELFTTGGA